MDILNNLKISIEQKIIETFSHRDSRSLSEAYQYHDHKKIIGNGVVQNYSTIRPDLQFPTRFHLSILQTKQKPTYFTFRPNTERK